MRKFAIVAAVILVLLVVADVVGRRIAEGQIADRVDAREGTDGTEVDIHGFSFLLQVLDREFSEVEVGIPTVTAESGRGRGLHVDDVALTLRDLTVNRDFSDAVAARAQGSGTVSYAELSRVLGVDVSYDEESGGLLLGLPVLGVDVRVTPDVEGGGLTLDGALPRLPAALRQVLGSAINLVGVPREVDVTGVEATESGLDVSLEAGQVSFSR